MMPPNSKVFVRRRIEECFEPMLVTQRYEWFEILAEWLEQRGWAEDLAIVVAALEDLPDEERPRGGRPTQLTRRKPDVLDPSGPE